MFYDDRVRDSLEVLADAERRAVLWNDPTVPETFQETYLALFEDSALAEALEAGDAYGTEIDAKLRKLDALCIGIGFDQPDSVVLADPRLRDVGVLAESILRMLRHRPLGTTVGSPLGPPKAT